MSASTRATGPKGGAVVTASQDQIASGDLSRCARSLETGGLVVFPTDTVYGVACNAFDPIAVAKIYALKGRSYSKPLPVFISNVEQLPLVASDVPKEAYPLMNRFWPGPLTLVFKTAPMALHAVRGRSTIAIRIPDHGVVRQIVSAAGLPLAVTSANMSNEPSIHSGALIEKKFRNKVDVIVNGGDCKIGRESSVVDASHYPFSILRQGALSRHLLAEALNLH